MYIYSSVMGIDMNKFTRFMTSPIIDEIIELSNSSLTNTASINYDIDKAIRDIKNEYRDGAMYSGYIKNKYTESIIKSLLKNTNLSESIIQDIKDELKIGKDRLNLSSFFESKILNGIVDDLIASNKNINIKNIYGNSFKGEDDEFEGEFDAEDEAVESSKIDPVKFFRWYQDSKKLNNKIKSLGTKNHRLATIELFERIKKEADSLKILGQMLGINQGLKRNDYDFYKYNNILSNYINSRLDKESVIKVDRKVIYRYLNKDGNLHETQNEKHYKLTAEGFDFNRFLNDSDYQKNVIVAYGEFTNHKELNILEYLSSSDHFMEMIKMSSDLKNKVYPSISVKFRSLIKAINELEKEKVYDSNGLFTKGIKEEVFNSLSNYFDDKLVNNFFETFNIKIKAVDGDPYTTINNKTDRFKSLSTRNKNFNLSTLNGRTEFTSWFENIVISKLKNGKLKDYSGEEFEADYLKDNKFLLTTDADSKKDLLTKEKYFFLKPKIEYSSSASSTDLALLKDIVDDFKKLKNVKYGDNNLHDLFFLYNLIVNRNKSTRQSFTYILSNGIDNNESSLHNQYLGFVKTLDKSTNYFLELDKSDVLTRGMAPKVKKMKDKGFYKILMSIDGKIMTKYYEGKNEIKIDKSNLSKNIVLNTLNPASSVKTLNGIKAFKDLYNLLNSDNLNMTIKC